jgi:hypothetical protein
MGRSYKRGEGKARLELRIYDFPQEHNHALPKNHLANSDPLQNQPPRQQHISFQPSPALQVLLNVASSSA